MLSKRERPKLGDIVEFKYRGHIRVGEIVAVAVTKTHFAVEIDHSSVYKTRSDWQGKRVRLRIALSQIVSVVSKEDVENEL